MVSGKYSALAGAVAREQSISNISANLANVNTSGYKRTNVTFESLLRGAKQITDAKGINYSRVKQNVSDFSQGPLRETENPYNAAIQGDGFFKLQGPEGVFYTRRGDFVVDQDGVLRTSSGRAVLDDAGGQITIPDPDSGKVVIAEDGSISRIGPDGVSADVGALSVVDVNDRSLLKREDETSFSLAPEGVEIPVDRPFVVVQGSLELSNVNMTEELTRMINSMRVFETYHKVLESYGTLGQELDDLGTVS